jgi:aldehyde:ferredoxin oxidoreductase
MKPKEYMGKVLEVDLSSKRMKVNQPDEEILYKYIGARGLGIRLLTDLTAAQINPFSPQNPLIFMTGPYNGTGVFSAFFNVTTKAPLTGISGSGHYGGKWGPRLKKAGFDGVIVKGASGSPRYLLIEEGNAALLDGQEIWGKGTMETDILPARFFEEDMTDEFEGGEEDP